MVDTKSPDVLWFDRPAARFMEAVPIGGGLVGATVFGGVSEERLALNHKQLWRAVKRDDPIPNVAHRIPEIRALFLAGRVLEGAQLAREILDGPTGGVDAFQPVGDLFIRADVTEAGEYVQALDMARGIHQTSCTANGASVVRTSFASGVDHVVATEVTSSAPSTLEFELARIDDPDCTLELHAQPEELSLVGRFAEGVCFAAVARVGSDEGIARPIDGCAAVEVRKARRAWAVVAMAVGEGDDDVLSAARRHLGSRCRTNRGRQIPASCSPTATRRGVMSLSAPLHGRRGLTRPNWPESRSACDSCCATRISIRSDSPRKPADHASRRHSRRRMDCPASACPETDRLAAGRS